MSSLIASSNLHLMMLEIAVENLFVPWTNEFDKVVLKKTTVMFRMLDKDWMPLLPHRHDCRPYLGSNYENEKFYGGRSVVFCVSTSFFDEDASGVNVQLYVKKETCKYFNMKARHDIGFASVPVDDLLNGISRQIRERNELEEYLSDCYKRQVISRSTKGTYTLRSEDFQDTEATISLYIRISCLGRSLVTEIATIDGSRELFFIRGEVEKEEEEKPYLIRKVTSKDLQMTGCPNDLPPVYTRDQLICQCKELDAEKVLDLFDHMFEEKIDHLIKDEGEINDLEDSNLLKKGKKKRRARRKDRKVKKDRKLREPPEPRAPAIALKEISAYRPPPVACLCRPLYSLHCRRQVRPVCFASYYPMACSPRYIYT